MTDGYSYFQSFDNYFWQWEEDGEVIAIPGGATMIYTRQLGEVIGSFDVQGLPSLGALLLAITATNANGAEALEGIYRISPFAQDKMFVVAREFLALLTQLPPWWKQGSKRIQLLQVLFRDGHGLHGQKDAAAIHAAWQAGFPADSPVFEKKQISPYQYDTDLRTLALLNNRFKTVEAVIDYVAGLPDPKQIPIEFDEVLSAAPDAPVATDLVGELIEHVHTFQVGALVPWLWGGLNIPMHTSMPSQQPLGGVSDLANKGSYDKLLISEFAHDDLVLLSRLANNEALYLQREIPPAHDALQRVVLIDVTLKNWGTPKTLAFAMAVAIARHPKTDIRCTAYVVDGDTYYAVSLDSRESIADGLQLVKGGLHAGGGLEAFLKDVGKRGSLEVFFITERTTLREGGLLRVLHDHQQAIRYVVHTDAGGSIDIYRTQGSAKKHLQHLLLPLDKLWAKPPRVKPGIRDEENKFLVDYPLLLEGMARANKLLKTGRGDIFQVTRDRSVLRLYDKTRPGERGWDLVCQELPFTPSSWAVGHAPEGHDVLLVHNAQVGEVVLINLQNGEKLSVNFQHGRFKGGPNFVFDGTAFIHGNQKGTWSISLDGAVRSITGNPGNAVKESQEVDRKDLGSRRGGDVLRNVHTVYINAENELVFNSHALQVYKRTNQVRLLGTGNTQAKARAHRRGEKSRYFDFADGSAIEVNHNGFAILRSSDEAIPWIYLPMVLATPLGVATDKIFAGNAYYYKDSLCRLTVDARASGQRLAAFKQLRLSTGLPLHELKAIIEAGGTVSLPLAKAKALQAELETLNVVATLQSPGGQHDLVQIEDADFFMRYVTPFINTVLNDGA